MQILVVDPSLFTLPYDRAFCRALATAGDDVVLAGRPLRDYESLEGEPFAFAPLYYHKTSRREQGWRTSGLGRVRKGLEHASGLRALGRLTAENHAGIIHFQWLTLPFLDRLALARLRRRAGLVLTVHNAEITTHSSSAILGPLGAALQGMGQEGAVKSFDRYIAHTSKTVDQLERLGIPQERILLLPHPPLDLDKLSSSGPTPGPTVTGAASDGDGRRDILLFGSIKPYKGLDVLVEAGLALAAQGRRDFRITVAGRPFQPLEALRARIQAAGAEDAFSFELGYLTDARLAELLAAAAVAVFPYRQIDGSGALALAARFEKPIVASRVGVFAEPPARECIALVPPGDAAALAACLADLLDDERKLAELTERGRRLQSLLPDWTAFAAACRRVYATIAAAR